MKYRFTLAVPNGKGDRPIHQIFAEHPAKNLQELADAIRRDDVILVEEFYAFNGAGEGEIAATEKRGYMLINWAHCAKVDEYREHSKKRLSAIR